MEKSRRVSWITKLRVLSGGAGAHITSVIFWIILAITSSIVLDSELMLIGDEWATTEGVLMDREVVESEDDDGNVSYSYEYTINYKVGAESYSTVCYSGTDNSYKIESAIVVEYNVNKPRFGRLLGTYSMPYGRVTPIIFLVILTITSVVLAYFLNKNRKLLHLLEYGALARGKLHASEATNTSINEQTVYEYTFKFEADGQEYFVKGKTHLYDNVEDEEYEKILYEVHDPSMATICDISPYLPKIENSGELIKQASIFSILGYTAITVIGFMAFFLINV
jgi:hypothetical protein